jgi:very-short-patch-repair endonuclease
LCALDNEFGLQILREEAIAGFIVDGLVEDKKLILEFYGDVFYCNPLKFQDPDEYCFWISRTVGQQWKRDERRLAALLKNGYKVLVVWEYDWNNNKQEVLERVENALR